MMHIPQNLTVIIHNCCRNPLHRDKDPRTSPAQHDSPWHRGFQSHFTNFGDSPKPSLGVCLPPRISRALRTCKTFQDANCATSGCQPSILTRMGGTPIDLDTKSLHAVHVSWRKPWGEEPWFFNKSPRTAFLVNCVNSPWSPMVFPPGVDSTSDKCLTKRPEAPWWETSIASVQESRKLQRCR